MKLKYTRPKVILTCCMNSLIGDNDAMAKQLRKAARITLINWQNAFDKGYFGELMSIRIQEASLGALIAQELWEKHSVEDMRIQDLCQCKELKLYRGQKDRHYIKR